MMEVMAEARLKEDKDLNDTFRLSVRRPAKPRHPAPIDLSSGISLANRYFVFIVLSTLSLEVGRPNEDKASRFPQTSS
jgi:hypothetical protein